MVTMTASQTAEHVLGFRVTQAKYGDLATLMHDLARRLGNDVEPLLVHQPRDHAEQRSLGLLQAQAGPHQFCVRLLAGEVVRLEMVRQVRIAAGVPVSSMPLTIPERRPSAAMPWSARAGRTEGFGGDLAGIGRADGRNVIRIEYARFEERYAGRGTRPR